MRPNRDQSKRKVSAVNIVNVARSAITCEISVSIIVIPSSRCEREIFVSRYLPRIKLSRVTGRGYNQDCFSAYKLWNFFSLFFSLAVQLELLSPATRYHEELPSCKRLVSRRTVLVASYYGERQACLPPPRATVANIYDILFSSAGL